MDYQNFDLEIVSSSALEERRFRARVLQSPEGESGYVNITWPFSVSEQQDLIVAIYGGLAVRRSTSPEKQRVERFGSLLFSAIFFGEIEHLFRASLSALKSGQGLRLRIRLPDDKDLQATPWEFLFDPKNSEFLAVKERTPLVRYLPVSRPAAPLAVTGPLAVLVAISAPTDCARLDASHEWENLSQALDPYIRRGLIALRRVEGKCTFDNFRDALCSGPCHVFHFVGHGVPGALIFQHESGEGVEMDVARLRAAFPSGALPRLIVLNACAGAIDANELGFSGVAQGFMKQGVPAVVAMQAAITDRAAIQLSRYFYRELVRGGNVDAALTEARLRLQGNGNAIEWGTPVLYMRAPDGRLFHTQRAIFAEGAPTPQPGKAAETTDEKAASSASTQVAFGDKASGEGWPISLIMFCIVIIEIALFLLPYMIT